MKTLEKLAISAWCAYNIVQILIGWRRFKRHAKELERIEEKLKNVKTRAEAECLIDQGYAALDRVKKERMKLWP